MNERELLVVNDADRMLLNTRAVTRALLSAAQEELNIEAESIHNTVDERKKAGQTTQIHDLLQERFTPRQLESMYQRFVDAARPEDLLYPDVPEYLRQLENAPDIADMTMTFGPEIQQEAKLAATGLDKRPYLITDTPTKGPIIAKWAKRKHVHPVVSRASTGLGVSALHVVLIDDKESAFRGPDGHVGGFVVKRLSEYPEAVQGELNLPEGTMLVHELAPVLGHILPPAPFGRTRLCEVYWQQAA